MESVQNFFNKKLTSEPQQTNNQTITNETQQPLFEPHQDPSCEPPVLPKKSFNAANFNCFRFGQ